MQYSLLSGTLQQAGYHCPPRRARAPPLAAFTACSNMVQGQLAGSSGGLAGQQRRQPRRLRATSWGASAIIADGSTKYTLILYTKPDCPLCEGLQQKLEAVIDRAQFLPSVLSNARVEIRDIHTNKVWQEEYEMAVPVLVRAEVDGSNEIVLPRPSPRLGAEGLAKHLEKVLSEDRWW